MSALSRLMPQEPASDEHLRSMRAAAFHRQGVVCVRLAEVSDPALRQAFEQWAEREFGRRSLTGNGGNHGKAQG